MKYLDALRAKREAPDPDDEAFWQEWRRQHDLPARAEVGATMSTITELKRNAICAAATFAVILLGAAIFHWALT